MREREVRQARGPERRSLGRAVRLCAAVWLGLASVASAEVTEPRLGCFADGERAWEIVGVPGNWMVRPVEGCTAQVSAWRVLVEQGDANREGQHESWLERMDAVSGAVEHREKLSPGTWAVFGDGAVVRLEDLEMPGAAGGVSQVQLVAEAWLAARVGEAWVLVAKPALKRDPVGEAQPDADSDGDAGIAIAAGGAAWQYLPVRDEARHGDPDAADGPATDSAVNTGADADRDRHAAVSAGPGEPRAEGLLP